MYARIHHFKRFCLKIVILNTVNNVFFSATIMTMFWNYWLTIPYYKVCKLECRNRYLAVTVFERRMM